MSGSYTRKLALSNGAGKARLPWHSTTSLSCATAVAGLASDPLSLPVPLIHGAGERVHLCLHILVHIERTRLRGRRQIGDGAAQRVVLLDQMIAEAVRVLDHARTLGIYANMPV